MANGRPTFILDASVAARWYLKDEQYSVEATQVLHDFGSSRISLLAPDHILYEVPSALKNAIRQSRLSPSQARSAIILFLNMGVPTVRSESLILMGFDESRRWGCSLYDGLYVALARAARAPLVHADDKLRKALGGRFPYELWIEDYTSPSVPPPA